jgi:hypothetical protein
MASFFLPLLALMFIGFKIVGVIAWPWLWVLAPIWAPLALALAVIVIFAGPWMIYRAVKR